MSLTYGELESITTDYFLSDGRKATDIYFQTSFLLDWLMNKKKGLWKRPNGGYKIRVPLMYDGAEGGFYNRSDALSSDDRENINAAYFTWKHLYGNATIYRTDELQNSGEYAEVELVAQKVEGAQKTATKFLAQNLYNSASDSSVLLTGIGSCCNSSTSTAYGSIATTDITAVDGTQPWVGRQTTTAEALSLPVIRTMRSTAKLYDGPDGKPNVITMPETLYNNVNGILQVQQRFATSDEVRAGFTHLLFEGCLLVADDFAPTGTANAINTQFMGFAIHADGFFVRNNWGDLTVAGGPAGRTMKIFWDGNLIVSNRKAHIQHTNLT